MNAIERALSGPVSGEEVEAFLDGVLEGAVDPVTAGGWLVAMRAHPVTGEVLAAGARALRRRMIAVDAPDRAIDTCGTGGDGAGTVNLSTAAALVVAACGGVVAKHGNRAVSSRSGSADVLEAWGFRVDLDVAEAAAAMQRTGFAFLMAPRFHPAMGKAAPVRRALGIRTLFNLLGPLANPAGVRRQVVGVWDAGLTAPMADALRLLGTEHALVVHGGGLDEIALHADTTGHLVAGGEVRPWSCAGRGVPLAALAGGDAATNASLLADALATGEGAIAEAVARNAGAALWIAGIAQSAAEGEERARARMRGGIDPRSFA